MSWCNVTGCGVGQGHRRVGARFAQSAQLMWRKGPGPWTLAGEARGLVTQHEGKEREEQSRIPCAVGNRCCDRNIGLTAIKWKMGEVKDDGEAANSNNSSDPDEVNSEHIERPIQFRMVDNKKQWY